MIEHVHDGFSWYHFIETTIPTVVTIVLVMLANRRSAKKEQDARHAEIKQSVDALVTQNKYFPPHKHKETKGPLLGENIEPAPSLEIT